MRGVQHAWEIWEIHGKCLSENLNARAHYKDVSVDGQDNTNMDLKAVRYDVVDSLFGSGQGLVAGSCKHDKETSVSIKLDQLSDYQLLQRNSAPMELGVLCCSFQLPHISMRVQSSRVSFLKHIGTQAQLKFMVQIQSSRMRTGCMRRAISDSSRKLPT